MIKEQSAADGRPSRTLCSKIIQLVVRAGRAAAPRFVLHFIRPERLEIRSINTGCRRKSEVIAAHVFVGIVELDDVDAACAVEHPHIEIVQDLCAVSLWRLSQVGRRVTTCPHAVDSTAPTGYLTSCPEVDCGLMLVPLPIDSFTARGRFSHSTQPPPPLQRPPLQQLAARGDGGKQYPRVVDRSNRRLRLRVLRVLGPSTAAGPARKNCTQIDQQGVEFSYYFIKQMDEHCTKIDQNGAALSIAVQKSHAFASISSEFCYNLRRLSRFSSISSFRSTKAR